MKKARFPEVVAAAILLAAVYPIYRLNPYAGTGVLLVGAALAGSRCGTGGTIRRLVSGLLFTLALTALWAVAFRRDAQELATAYLTAVAEDIFLLGGGQCPVREAVKSNLTILMLLTAWCAYLVYFNASLLFKRLHALWGLLLFLELFFLGALAESAYTPIELLYSFPGGGLLNTTAPPAKLLLPAAGAAALAWWAIWNLRHPKSQNWKNFARFAGGFAAFCLAAWGISSAALFAYSGRLIERTEYLADRRPAPPEQLYREILELESRMELPEGISMPRSGFPWWQPSMPKVAPDDLKERTLKFVDSAEGKAYFARVYRQLALTARLLGEYRYVESRTGVLRSTEKCREITRRVTDAAALAHYRGETERVLPLLEPLEKLVRAVSSRGGILYQLTGWGIAAEHLAFAVSCGPELPEYAPHYRSLLDQCRREMFRPRADGEIREELKAIRRFRPPRNVGAKDSLCWRIVRYPKYCATLTRNLNAVLKLVAEAEKHGGYSAMPLPDATDLNRYCYASVMREHIAARVLYSIALALKVRRCEKGAYPETLDALVPEYLDRLPVSPRSGSVPAYRKLPNGIFELRDRPGDEVLLSPPAVTSRPHY